jgi:hypothetical protein
MSHYNKAFFQLAEVEMHTQLLALPTDFNSVQFCNEFSRNHNQEYLWLVKRFMTRGYDRPHAVQIANREITHTLKNKFPDLVEKIGEAPNHYHGGTMSLWRRKG